MSDCREETVEWRAEGVLDQAFPRGSWWWDRGAGDSQERLNRLSGPSLTGSEGMNHDPHTPAVHTHTHSRTPLRPGKCVGGGGLERVCFCFCGRK